MQALGRGPFRRGESGRNLPENVEAGRGVCYNQKDNYREERGGEATVQVEDFEILETKERVLADNDAAARTVREKTSRAGVFFVNLMAGPGAGKTSTLLRIIEGLGGELRIGVMEADADGDTDARTIAGTGTRAIQLHTGGLCHMDADMTLRGMEGLGLEGLDLLFLENVGNLVCPAEFEVGADLRLMILSVPEGDDKPLKYPLMFRISDCLLVNKMDTAPAFDFDLEALKQRAWALNPRLAVFPVSARTGEGFPAFLDWLRARKEEKA